MNSHWKNFVLSLTIFIMLVPACFATKSTRTHARKFKRHYPSKLFPATRESVLNENYRADLLGYPRISSRESLQEAVSSGRLSSVTLSCAKQLPKDRRYLLPEAEAFIEQLNKEFYEATGQQLTVDSAVRPAAVQVKLARWNRNAAPAYGEAASSHERGTTVDISRCISPGAYKWLLWRLFYYRELGRILVIEESACLHIFVGEVPDGSQLHDIQNYQALPEGDGRTFTASVPSPYCRGGNVGP